MTTYSALGPWTGAPVPDVKVTVDPIDLTPIVQAMSRLEILLANLTPEPPIVHVAAPNVVIEQKPLDCPVIEVHCPEPVVNITVPEPVIKALEVTVSLPSLRVMIVMNIIVIIAFLIMAGLAIRDAYFLSS